jgi:alpha-amylase
MNTESLTYRILAKLIKFRLNMKLWKKQQVQRYADDVFYAFTRGDILCLFTNTQDYIIRDITYHDYKDGQQLCNMFNKEECVQVKNGKIRITMGGDFKVYIPYKRRNLVYLE